MFTDMNPLLESIRFQLTEDVKRLDEQEQGDEAWGPGSDNDASIHGEPGESGASNENNIWDAFDAYMSDLVYDLMDKYDCDEEQATEFIFQVADDLAGDDMMLPIPAEDDPQAIAMWLGRAGTIGFERQVLDAALASSENEE